MKDKHLRLIENKNIEKQQEFVVKCTDIGEEDLYWSNDFGWCNLAGAQRFTNQETKELRLPLDGEWVNLTELKESMERHPVNHKKRPNLRVIEDQL
jgi:hypothetical protein